MYRQTIYLGGRAFPCGYRSADRFGPPPSLAWCCPVCGDVWARALLQAPGQEPRRFMFLTAACEQHEDPLLPSLVVSGSLLTEIAADFNDSLPLSLWEREFQLHLNFTRKNAHVNYADEPAYA